MQGIGLGLVISQMIVKKFNGQIDFLSKYKKGSTFFFNFELEKVNPSFFEAGGITRSFLSSLYIYDDEDSETNDVIFENEIVSTQIDFF